MTNIIIPIVCLGVLMAIQLQEKEQDAKWNECETTDWNKFYAVN